MAINDVLPLRAARRDTSANLNVIFGARGHQRPNFDDFIYICYAAPPYSAGINAITSYFLAKFGWVPFDELRVLSLAKK